MKKRLDKVVATAIAFLILVLPGALSGRERRGAKLEITLKDGQYIVGKLIAVKPDSLLLLNPAQKDESIDIVRIRSIRIVKKSKALLGGVCGFIAGSVAGGLSTEKAENELKASFDALGIVFAGLGIGIGAGMWAGKDKIIRLEGMSESDRVKALDELRHKARIRN